MVTLQEVDTNESTAAVTIKGPPTTMPTAEREAASPEPARMVATPPVNAHAVLQRVCHRLNLAEVLQKCTNWFSKFALINSISARLSFVPESIFYICDKKNVPSSHNNG